MSGAVALRGAGQRVSTITVGSSPTGALVNQGLCGGLFGLTTANEGAAGPQPALIGMRIDGFQHVTPTKAGGTDAGHPTLGHSGSYSYDWGIIDATLTAAAGDGVTEPYISLDYCPQLLGGALAPTTAHPPPFIGAGSAPQVPNDLAAFATMCADFVHHCVVVKGANMPRWGLWNEPDGGYWLGTQAQYFAMYAAVAAAVKAAVPAVKVGGPELSYLQATGWLSAFLTYCKTNSVPVDFVSWHDYEGTAYSIAVSLAFLAQTVASVGWATPLDTIVGEFSPATIQNWPAGNPPWAIDPTQQLQLDDHAAALTAIYMMEAQAQGLTRLYHFKSSAELTDGPSVTGGLYSVNGPWATGNVVNVFSKMGAGHVLPVTLDADPGIHAMACSTTTDLTGTVRVLIANDHYERTKTYPATVAFPVADGRATTLYMIDQAHSNRFQAGPSHTNLETVPCPVTSGAKVILPPLAARSVCLLEITP